MGRDILWLICMKERSLSILRNRVCLENWRRRASICITCWERWFMISIGRPCLEALSMRRIIIPMFSTSRVPTSIGPFKVHRVIFKAYILIWSLCWFPYNRKIFPCLHSQDLQNIRLKTLKTRVIFMSLTTNSHISIPFLSIQKKRVRYHQHHINIARIPMMREITSRNTSQATVRTNNSGAKRTWWVLKP